MGEIVNLIEPKSGRVVAMDSDDSIALGRRLAEGWTLEGAGATAARSAKAGIAEATGANTTVGKIKGVISEVAGGASLGVTTALEATDPDRAEAIRAFREANPGLATGANLVGAVGPALLSGGASAAGALSRGTISGQVGRLATAIAKTAPEAGALAKVGRAAGGAALEGALQAGGQRMADLAVAEDPISIQRYMGEIGSSFLLGGVTGGAIGGGLRVTELALGAAARRLAKTRDEATRLGAVPDDLAELDAKGLRLAKEAEEGALEAARVPKRQELVDDLVAYRNAGLSDEPWQAVATGKKLSKRAKQKLIDAGKELPPQGARWMREEGRTWIKAHRTIDNALDDLKGLADKTPEAASARAAVAKALRIEEQAIGKIMERGAELKAFYLADSTPTRANAFAKLPKALETNRALQERIANLAKPLESPRLTAIADAKDALTGRKATLGEKVAAGAAFGAVSGAAMATDLPGMQYVAPVLGAAAAARVSGGLAGTLAQLTRSAADRTSRAAAAFTNVAAKVQRTAPVLATKVLESMRFAPEGKRPAAPAPSPLTGPKPTTPLAVAFEARSRELAQVVMPTPAGPKVRPAVRAQIAAQLDGVRAIAPHVADRLETLAARRLEFYAAKLPRTTVLGMTRIPPTELQKRAWARYVAAAEDPAAIEERLVDGTVTPEDAEVMRELYPERLMALTTAIIENMAELRAGLPHQRRLALSIFTGAPVDAAMVPHVLGTLQAAHAREPGSEGGTQAPQPQPAFASVKKSVPSPTPAQARAG